jgi:hypothetical protein
MWHHPPMITLRRASLLVAAALCAAAPAVHAESHAWSAAKKVLPGGLLGIGGINLGTLKSSQLYQQFLPIMMAQSGQAKDHLEVIKRVCAIDFTDVVDSVVLALEADEKGVIIIALKGTTQAALEACGQKISAADKKKLTVAKDGANMRYSVVGEKQSLYARWLSKDTVAFAISPDDKAMLERMVAGGLDKDPALKKPVSTVNTGAALWFAVNKSTPLDQLKVTAKLAYGSGDIAAGNVAVDAHLVVDDAKAATAAAADANTKLDAAKKSGQLPPIFNSLLKSLAIKAAGAEVVITASMAEKDLLAILAMFVPKP